MPTDQLFSHNLNTLRQYGCAAIADQLETVVLPDGILVGQFGQGDLNINLGHTLFYSAGAEGYATEQVASFLKDPKRFYVQPPMFGSVFLNREEELYRAVFEKFGDIDEQAANTLHDMDAGYLLSFGIGLGLHLPKLLERLEVRELVLVEQFWEFLVLSLKVMDWKPLFEVLHARGGSIQFLVDADPVNLANAAFKGLRGRQFGLIDGSFGFQHYRSPVLDKAHALFRDMLPSLAMSEGFFDDECVMFRHARENLENQSFSIFDGLAKESPLNGCPVFIVGSGPSVDQALEAIKHNRDNAVVISAGTGLGVLLRAGIKPHFHCETENLPIVYEAVKSHKDGGRDFSGVHLIASPTVDPRIPPEFDDVTFVFRQSLTSSILFSQHHSSLPTGATVANFACRFALELGAGRIYLFGVDLGSTTLKKHHSVDSVYLRSKDSFWQSGLGMLPMDMEVPGNLRDKVYSNALFMFTRTHFHNMIAQNIATRFFNCSDGAKIEGAIPLQPDLVRLPAPKDSFDGLAQEVISQLPHYRKGSYPVPDTVDKYRQAIRAWHQAYKEIDHDGFLQFYNGLTGLLSSEGDVYEEAARALNAGTVLLMVQFGFFYMRRLPEEKRGEFVAYFLNAMDAQVAGMKADFETLLDG